MESTFILYIARRALETALLISLPTLLTCMIVGIVVTLLQAVTSMRDMTLTVVPKLLAVGAVIIIFSNWMLAVMLRFTNEIFAQIQNIGH